MTGLSLIFRPFNIRHLASYASNVRPRSLVSAIIYVSHRHQQLRKRRRHFKNCGAINCPYNGLEVPITES